MRGFRTVLLTAAVAAAALVANGAGATTVDWASLTGDNGVDTVTGSIGAVGVTLANSTPYGFDQINGGGTDYWTTIGVGSPNYTQGVVNRPTGPDIVALSAAGTETISFSKPVTNVFIAFNSFNGADVTFSAPFTIISQGCGYWGCGTFVPNGGNTGFTGNGETVGVLEFTGTFTSLSFTDTVGENWHGITVGVSAVPEAATWALMIGGLGLMGAALRRRRSTTFA